MGDPRQQAYVFDDETLFSTCSCAGTLRAFTNFADGERPLGIVYTHEDGCGRDWFPWREGEPMSADKLMLTALPPETANEHRLVLTELVDSEQCDPRCMFADPLKFKSCDCVCEGKYHGEMRIADE